MSAVVTIPGPCEWCLAPATDCDGSCVVPVYRSDDACPKCGAHELTYLDGRAFCDACESETAMCTCHVVGDEDVICGRCREYARDDARMGVA